MVDFSISFAYVLSPCSWVINHADKALLCYVRDIMQLTSNYPIGKASYFGSRKWSESVSSEHIEVNGGNF